MNMRIKYFKMIICFLCIIILVGCCSSCVRDTETSNNRPDGIFVMDLPQINKTNQRIYYVEWGKLTNNSYNDSVMIFSDIDDSSIQSNIYLVANTDGKILVYNIGRWDTVVFQNGSLDLIDLDNDGVDEILLHMEITGNGATITQIFKVIDESIVLWDDIGTKDVSITSRFENNYIYVMENNEFDFSYLFDIKDLFDIRDELIPEFFDDNGKGLGAADIMLLPIDSCVIENVDGDEILECSRGVKILRSYCGQIITRFQYNSESKSMELIKIDFIPR